METRWIRVLEEEIPRYLYEKRNHSRSSRGSRSVVMENRTVKRIIFRNEHERMLREKYLLKGLSA